MEMLAIGLGIGLASGVSPGPLLTLVLTATLERGFGAGLRVASAPLVTDLPIIAACLVVLRSVPEVFLVAVTLAGGVFVVYVGIKTALGARQWGEESVDKPVERPASRDLWHGALVNVLSPHPWIFWLGVGVPAILSLWARSAVLAVGYVFFFFVGLVGSKTAIAGVVVRSRHHLGQRWYQVVLVACGVALMAFGVLLLVRGASAVFQGGQI
jgi:threonine/homoserine/homoserine lactone efflux protein